MGQGPLKNAVSAVSDLSVIRGISGAARWGNSPLLKNTKGGCCLWGFSLEEAPVSFCMVLKRKSFSENNRNRQENFGFLVYFYSGMLINFTI